VIANDAAIPVTRSRPYGLITLHCVLSVSCRPSAGAGFPRLLRLAFRDANTDLPPHLLSPPGRRDHGVGAEPWSGLAVRRKRPSLRTMITFSSRFSTFPRSSRDGRCPGEAPSPGGRRVWCMFSVPLLPFPRGDWRVTNCRDLRATSPLPRLLKEGGTTSRLLLRKAYPMTSYLFVLFVFSPAPCLLGLKKEGGGPAGVLIEVSDGGDRSPPPSGSTVQGMNPQDPLNQ
jgi:hypothetical protein